MKAFILLAIAFGTQVSFAYTAKECRQYCDTGSARCIAMGGAQKTLEPYFELSRAAKLKLDTVVPSICNRAVKFNGDNVLLPGASCVIQDNIFGNVAVSHFPENVAGLVNVATETQQIDLSFLNQKPEFEITADGESAPWTIGAVEFVSFAYNQKKVIWSNAHSCFSAPMKP